jgi:cytoskeletal protein CcmA (bactofilin family)
MIEGTFEGTLKVTELLELRETARVEGEISYGKLKIDPGAVLSGNVQNSESTSKQRSNKKEAAVV